MIGTGIGPTWLMRHAAAAALATVLALAGVTWPGSPSWAEEAPPASTAIEAAPLDGQTFSAGIVRVGADADGPLGDELMFSDGMFISAVCKRFNFVEAPYWVRLEGDRIHFLAELSSPTDGRMLWKGTIQDGTLEGTMRWTKKRWYWTIDTEHEIQGEILVAADGGSAAAD